MLPLSWIAVVFVLLLARNATAQSEYLLDFMLLHSSVDHCVSHLRRLLV